MTSEAPGGYTAEDDARYAELVAERDRVYAEELSKAKGRLGVRTRRRSSR
jgi:hypothetical protein